MIRVVLDTNVVVSAALTRSGPSSAILELADQGLIQLWISPAIFDEYKEILGRLRVGVLPERARRMLSGLQRMGQFFAPTKTVSISPDADDNMVIECAEAAKAHYLVTGNIRHFPARWKYTKTVTPREFLNLWQLQKPMADK